MAIEFEKEEVIKREKFVRETYIGYFSPTGELINFNIMLGSNYHNSWQNPVSWTFLSFVSYIIKNTSIEKLKNSPIGKQYPNTIINNQYLGIDEYVKRGYGYDYDFNYDSFDSFISFLEKEINRLKRYKYDDVYDRFKYDLLLFFKNAYNNRRFFDAIGKNIMVEDDITINKRNAAKPRNHELSYSDEVKFYREYLQEELLSHLKDICVQYLGYDSLERFGTNNKEIFISPHEEYNLDFNKNPRVITSSYPNVNERYYNYLLMDWRVDKVPRFFFNEQKGIYETHDYFDYYESEKEKNLEKEIHAVRKLVPINERHKYFR